MDTTLIFALIVAVGAAFAAIKHKAIKTFWREWRDLFYAILVMFGGIVGTLVVYTIFLILYAIAIAVIVTAIVGPIVLLLKWLL